MIRRGFNAFRGDAWMREPCRSCARKTVDFGGCRCQAFMLTGEAREADPVCHLSPHHHVVAKILATAEAEEPKAYAYRRMRPAQAMRREHPLDISAD